MKKVVIVGVGALGSNLLLSARNLKVEWTVIDFDRVEMKNTMSQFHTKMSIGRNKAQSLQQSMQGLFGLKINAIPHKLTNDNTKNLLGQADLVIDCVDNAETRKLIQDFCRANNTPCLHGALAPNGEFGRAIWTEQFIIDDATGMGAATCEDGEHLPFISLVSSIIAEAAKSFIAKSEKNNFQIFPGGLIKI